MGYGTHFLRRNHGMSRGTRGGALPPTGATPITRVRGRETKCPTQFARYVDPPLLPSHSIIRDGGTHVRRVEHLNFGILRHKCSAHRNTGTKPDFNYRRWRGKLPM